MKISIVDVLKYEGKVQPFSDVEISIEPFSMAGEEISLRSPICVSGSFENMGDGVIRLLCQGDYTLCLLCSSCGKPFERTEHLQLDEVLQNEEDVPPVIEGGFADLDEIVRSHIVLHLDMRHLCTPDCKGLCAMCGKDLNEGPCGCEPPMDPRLSVLNQLKEV